MKNPNWKWEKYQPYATACREGWRIERADLYIVVQQRYRLSVNGELVWIGYMHLRGNVSVDLFGSLDNNPQTGEAARLQAQVELIRLEHAIRQMAQDAK